MRCPARHLEQIEDQLTIAQRVEDHRHGAEVEGRRAHREQVAGDSVELEVDHPQVLGARGHLLVEQRLDGHAVGHRVEVVGQVVHPLDERDRLPVLLVLAALLDARVDVADQRREVAHDLSLDRQ